MYMGVELARFCHDNSSIEIYIPKCVSNGSLCCLELFCLNSVKFGVILIHVSADDSIGIGKEPWVSER